MVRVKGQLDPNDKQWFYFRFWWEHQKGSPSGPMRQIQLAQLPWTWISVQEDIGRVWGRFELRKKYIHGAQWNSQNATVSRYLNFMTFFISRNIWCISRVQRRKGAKSYSADKHVKHLGEAIWHLFLCHPTLESDTGSM